MERRAAPLTGRDVPLGRLREAASAARSGVPGTVLVEGEAGIGKSSLVAELAHEEADHGAVVLWGNCSAVAGRDVPLGPFVDALGDLRRALGDEAFAQAAGPRLSVLAGLLPGVLAGTTDGAAPTMGQVYGVVTDVLRAASADRPVLLLLEDVHWADDSTLDLIDYLARSLRSEQLLVVVTARTDDAAYERVRGQLAEVGRAPGAVRLELQRLTPEEVADQVRSLSGEDVDVDRVVELSGGLPFLVEQVVEAGVEESGALASRLLGHRIAALTSDVRAVVDAAAVALTSPTASDVASVSGVDPLQADRALREGVRAGVLVLRGETVGFRHALLQEATLEDVLPLSARELHRRWAEVLAGRLGAEVPLAHHRIAAGEPGPALEACLVAAAHMGRVSAYVERERMLERAVDLWPHVPDAESRTGTDLPALLADTAETAQLTQRNELAADLLARARELLPSSASPERRAWLDVLDLWGRADDHAGSPEEVRATASAFDGRPASRQQAMAYVVAASALSQHGDPEGSHDYAHRALMTARELGDLVLESRALMMSGMALSGLGRMAEAVTSMRSAVAIADRSGDLAVRTTARSGLAVGGWTAGHFDEATRVTRDAIELLGGDRPGPLARSWVLHCSNLVEELCESGEWEEAAALLARAGDVVDASEDRIGGSLMRLRGQLGVWRGDRDLDLDWTEELAVRALDSSNLDDLVWGNLSWADAASMLGATDVARTIYRPVLADDRTATLPDGTIRVIAIAARTEADLGRRPEDPDGEWFAERIGWFLDAMPPRNPRHTAYAASARAHLLRRTGDDDRATWVEVVEQWREASVPHELGWALVRLAEVAVHEGERAEAAAALEEARAIATRLRATPLADSADAVARRARLPGSSDGELPFGLTARELEVLTLVADGASNAEIGRQLFISAKTASVHVTHILQKLDVRTRVEAAAVAHRSGIADAAGQRR